MESSACGICHVQFSRYTCPRCHIPYCTLACYKDCKHASCSEDFYQRNIKEQLKGQHSNSTGEEKKRMLYVLRHLNDSEFDVNDDDDMEEEIDSMADRLSGLDVMNASFDTLWSALSEEQRIDFQRAVSDGRVSDMLPVWEPWWRTNTVATIHPGIHDDACISNGRMPAILASIPTFKHQSPSKLLRYALVDLLFSYVYGALLFNGDDELDMNVVCSVSPTLHVSASPQHSVSAALHACIQVLPSPPPVPVMRILASLEELLRCPRADVAAKAALSQLYHALAEAKLKASQKKVLFYLSWLDSKVASDTREMLCMLATGVFSVQQEVNVSGEGKEFALKLP